VSVPQLLAVAAPEFKGLTELGANECGGDAAEFVGLVRTADEPSTRQLVDLLAGALRGAS
jgi:hypothetical protein